MCNTYIVPLKRTDTLFLMIPHILTHSNRTYDLSLFNNYWKSFNGIWIASLKQKKAYLKVSKDKFTFLTLIYTSRKEADYIDLKYLTMVSICDKLLSNKVFCMPLFSFSIGNPWHKQWSWASNQLCEKSSVGFISVKKENRNKIY